MKKNAVIALVGVSIVAAAGWWWSGSGERAAAKSAKGPAAAPTALVTLATAVRQDVPVTVQVNGSVVSLNSVDLLSLIHI